ncbi:MAG: type VI secretion system tube protein Hcp [Marmoricola sp.]
MFRTRRIRTAAILASGVVASTVGVVALTPGAGNEALGTAAAIGGTCTGATQGVIGSGSSVAGHRGLWSISKLTDGITTSSSTTRLPAPHEKGIKVTTGLGQATIGLVRAEINGEDLSSCTFNFYRPAANGSMVLYFQIRLATAHVVSYSLTGSPTAGNTTAFSFVAQKIVRTWVAGGKSVSDTTTGP